MDLRSGTVTALPPSSRLPNISETPPPITPLHRRPMPVSPQPQRTSPRASDCVPPSIPPRPSRHSGTSPPWLCDINVSASSRSSASEVIEQNYPPGTPSFRVKLPAFNDAEPALWLRHAELLLSNTPVSQRKIQLLEAIPSATLFNLGVDLHASYEELISAFKIFHARTAEQKLQQLLAERDIGDRKPSVVLRQLQELASNNSTLVTWKFKELLPVNLRTTAITMEAEGKSLEEIARIMDIIISNAPEKSSISINQTNDELTKLIQEVKLLREQASNPKQKPTFSQKQEPFICWYHLTFKDKARKCEDGCQYRRKRSSFGVATLDESEN